MLLLVLLALLILLIEIRVLSYAYRKIGVHPRYVFVVMVLSLLGSYVNLPLFAMQGTVVALNGVFLTGIIAGLLA